MKNLLLAAMFAGGVCAAVEAAPTDTVTKADLQALIERLNRLEAENKAQAAKIAELEGTAKKAPAAVVSTAKRADDGTGISDSGRVYTTDTGKRYFLADAAANIFEPLSESGLQITPYGYLVFEGVYSTRPLDCDWSADFVKPKGRTSNTTLSMQDSILGLQFDTPEALGGWKFTGRAEFDLAGGDQNSYDFHWRHLYVDAQHESGWSILFGQTWHLWKMVSPSEIDGAWMENAGHPYRRSPQLRITKKWDWEESSLEARVGIVKGGPGMGGDRDEDGVQDNSASAWVLFEGALVYDCVAPWQENKDDRWLVGVGGMWGRDKSHRYGYGALDADGSPDYGFSDYMADEYDSMMGMVAASVPFWKFTLTGQFYAGQNLGGVQAGCAQTVTYRKAPYLGGFVRGNEVRSIGGFVDLGFKLNSKWSFAIGYGCDDPVDGDVEDTINGFCLFNDRAYVNATYKVTDNLRVALEYARLMTRYAQGTCEGVWYDGRHSGDYDADRIQFSAYFDF